MTAKASAAPPIDAVLREEIDELIDDFGRTPKRMDRTNDARERCAALCGASKRPISHVRDREMARPTRFETATSAFGGQGLFERRAPPQESG
jgi:hypothetical protein